MGRWDDRDSVWKERVQNGVDGGGAWDGGAELPFEKRDATPAAAGDAYEWMFCDWPDMGVELDLIMANGAGIFVVSIGW